MKGKITILLVFMIFQYTLKSQVFDVSIDTTYLDLKKIVRPATRVSLTHAVKLEDKYYCFFLEQGLYSFRLNKRYFLIISKNGTILNNIKVPNKIEYGSLYFDFFKKKNGLFVKTYLDQTSFYFDIKKLKWEKINELDDLVYGDENFEIAYLDFGEWGETTWFIDKKTKKEYVIGTLGTTVNKLKDKYYLTNGLEIREIDDPLKLKPCDQDYYYKKTGVNNFHYGTNSIIGSKIIYRDTTFSDWDFQKPKRYIETSFVFNNQLLQVYTDNNSTYIAKIKNGKIVPIQNLGKKYSIFNWYNSYRGNNLNNYSRFLKFKEDNNTYGFIEINNNKINIQYLKHNVDSLKYLKSDRFLNFLNEVASRFDNFSMEQVYEIEKKLGGIDMKTDRIGNSHNGYYPNKQNFKIAGSKEYIKVIDEIITQTTEYFYIDKNASVKAIYINWELTNHYNKGNSSNLFLNKNPVIITRMKSKFSEIEQIITKQLRMRPVRKGKENSLELNWKSADGLKIILYGSRPKEIRMIIYKE